MDRRSLLLAVLNNGTWEQYSYQYLYYSLIPQTINGKNVTNKGKLGKIYGNGVIENQLISDNFTDVNYWAKNRLTQVNNNNIGTFVTNSSAYNFCSFYHSFAAGELKKNHYYIYSLRFRVTSGNCSRFEINHHSIRVDYADNPVLNTWYELKGIIQQTREDSVTTNGFDVTRRYTNTSDIVVDSDSFEVKEPQIIDLTLMFGTGNEPTTLTDNRIQNILNRGYIAYNTGTYKSTDIGEIIAEPYNLFDGELEQGSISTSGSDVENNSVIRTKNWIKVLPNQSYTTEIDNNSWGGNVFLYGREDKNDSSTGRFLTNKSTQVSTYTIPSGINYIRFSLTNKTSVPSTNEVCFHRTGTRTGYAPYTQPQTLPFKYQGNGAINSHDTLEITSSGYVFTKNVNGYAELSSLTWNYNSGNDIFYTTSKKPADIANWADIVCDKYATDTQKYPSNIPDKTISSRDYYFDGNLYFKDTSLSGDTTLISGKLWYQLATPQVITIPKKHLAWIDLGTLTWEYNNAWVCWRASEIMSVVKKPSTTSTIANIYCVNYPTIAQSSRGTANSIFIFTEGRIGVVNGSTTISPTGYLFYETQDEVPDFADILGIEAGGTLTGAEYSYVKNQLVQASNLLPTNSFTQYGVTFSRNTTDKTVTISGLCSTSMTIDITTSISITAGHKYWLFSGITGTASTYHLVEVSGNKKSYQGSIYTLNNATAKYAIYVNSGYNINLTFKPQIIDLTVMFGAGNEPTSTSDKRIQDLINNGYIPYNTGENAIKVCEVLPNVDMLFKCK